MLKTNEEFRELIPPLTSEEYAQLEQNILAEGIRDKLVTWNRTIIDGHNRYEISKKHNVEFEIIEMEFDTREEVIVWIIENQLGRRNLPEFVQFELRHKEKDILLKKGKEKLSESGKLHTGNQYTKVEPLSTIDKPSTVPTHNTRDEMANKLNWSTGKVAQAEIVIKKAPEEIKQRLRNSDISINQAYKEIKNVEKKIEFEKQIEDIRTTAVEMPTGKYQCIVLDPPWSYGTKYSATGRRVANPYPEMSQDELKELEILSEDDSIIFLWTTQRFIWDAKELLDHWGFNYRSMIVWDKEQMGMGDLLRMQCEFCLVGIKGKPLLNNPNNIRDIIREPRREHSRKPESFYEIVNTLCVGSKIEYFSRTEREGWKSFGNETDKF